MEQTKMNDKILAEMKHKGLLSPVVILALERRRSGERYSDLVRVFGNEASGMTGADARRHMIGGLMSAFRATPHHRGITRASVRAYLANIRPRTWR